MCTLCTLLLRPRQAWLFSAPLLPVLARLCGVPLRVLPLANTLAAACSSAELLYLLGSHLLGPFQLAAAACRELMQVRGGCGPPNVTVPNPPPPLIPLYVGQPPPR